MVEASNLTFVPRQPVEIELEEAPSKEVEISQAPYYPEFNAEEVDHVDWGFDLVESYFPDPTIEDTFNVRQTPGTFVDEEFPPWADNKMDPGVNAKCVMMRRVTHIKDPKHEGGVEPEEEFEFPKAMTLCDKSTQQQYEEFLHPRADFYSQQCMVLKAGQVQENAVYSLLKMDTPKQIREKNGEKEEEGASSYLRMPSCMVINETRDPEFSQRLGSMLYMIDENGAKTLPHGQFLWELIYPQADIAFHEDDPIMPAQTDDQEEPPEVIPPPPPSRITLPVLNPSGKYIVKLFLFGKWRQIVVDDFVPCGQREEASAFYTLMPQACTNSILGRLLNVPAPLSKKRKQKSDPRRDTEKFGSIWSQILAKAILKVSKDYGQIPFMHLLTGYMPIVKPMNWVSLSHYLQPKYEFLHVLVKSETSSKDDDKESDGDEINQSMNLGKQGGRLDLVWSICEINENRDDNGTVVHRQVRLKQGENKPQCYMEAKLLRTLDNDDDSQSSSGGESSGGEKDRKMALAQKKQREAARAERRRIAEEGNSQCRGIEGGWWMDYEDFQDFVDKLIYYNPPDKYTTTEYESIWAKNGLQNAIPESGPGSAEMPWLIPYTTEFPPRPVMMRVRVRKIPAIAARARAALLASKAQEAGEEEEGFSEMSSNPQGEPSCSGGLDDDMLSWASDNELDDAGDASAAEGAKKSDNSAGEDAEGEQKGSGEEKPIQENLKDETFESKANASVLMSMEPLDPAESGGVYLINANSWKYATLDADQDKRSQKCSGNTMTSNTNKKSSPFMDENPVDVNSRITHLTNVGGTRRRQASLQLPLPDLVERPTGPPGVEYWKLILEPRQNLGGTRLATFVENNEQYRSRTSFLDPVHCLEKKAKIPVLKITNEKTEEEKQTYQKGYNILAKYEFKARLPKKKKRRITALSYIANQDLQQHLRITFLVRRKNENDTGEEGSSHAVFTKKIFSTAFIPIFSFELPKDEENFIVLLEAFLPEATQETSYYIHMFEQMITSDRVKGNPFNDQLKAKVEEYSLLPISFANRRLYESALQDLKSFEPLILREKIVVRAEEAVNATLRITCNFPDVYFVAKLILQKPPTEEMRRSGRDEEEELPPIGAILDPAEYHGRANWLASLEEGCREEGYDSVIFPHLEFAKGSTYILQVELDQSGCKKRMELPVNPEPEGGEEEADPASLYKWNLEFFSDGELEVGNDTTEFDLETLVLKSWADEAGVSREDRAEAARTSRQLWLDEGAQGEFNALFLCNVERPEDVSAEDLIKERYDHNLSSLGHMTEHMVQFLYDTLQREKVVEITSKDLPPDAMAAVKPTGDGTQSSAELKIQESQKLWEEYKAKCDAAVEANKEIFATVLQWYNNIPFCEFKSTALREELSIFITNRWEKQAALTELLMTPPIVEELLSNVDELKAALEAAKEAQVPVINETLIKTTEKRLKLHEKTLVLEEKVKAFDEFKEREKPVEDLDVSSYEEEEITLFEVVCAAYDAAKDYLPLALPVPLGEKTEALLEKAKEMTTIVEEEDT